MNIKHDYSTLFYYSPLPKWVYEIDTFQILDVNQAALNRYGYNKDEFMNLTIKELRPKEEISKVLDAHRNIGAVKGNIHFGVFTHQKKNGEKIRVDINGHKVNFQGKDCIMVVSQDVTLLEKQLIELQESENKLKTASEIAKIGYWKFDIHANRLFWSDKVYKIWGVSKNGVTLSFDYFFNSIHPDDRAVFEREQAAALSGEKALDFAHRIILQDGTVKWVREQGRLNKDKEGNPLSFEGTVQDITRQKEEEQHLKLLESVITHTHDAVLITEAEPVDEPGPRIVYVNEAFTQMTGYTAAEVLGKSPRFLQGPKSDKKKLAKLSQALKNWKPYEITTINYKKNGEPFWINFTVIPVANEKGWYTHWIAIERDITVLKTKQLQKELMANISAAFNREAALKSSLEALCRLIAQYGDFSFCEIWLPATLKKTLKLQASIAADAAAETFYNHAQTVGEVTFKQGLPGKVWKRKKLVVLGDADRNEQFARQAAAQKAKLKTVVGIPLRHQDDLVGVMLVGSQEDTRKLKPYQSTFKELELFIGSEINRKRLENDLSHLFDTLPDLICLIDENGRFLKINKAGRKLTGYKKKEIIGSSFQFFTHPLDKGIFKSRLVNLPQGENIFKFENRCITKSDQIIWLSWHCNYIAEEGVIYATAKNVTEEKKLRELAASASKLARIGGWEIDLVADTIFWSGMVHELHETDPGSFVPDFEKVVKFFREDYREKVVNIVTEATEKMTSFDFEVPIITAKGNQRWVRIIGASEFLGDTCVRIFGSFQDINTRKETELRLKSITDDLPGVAFQYYLYPDGTDKLVSVSEASYRIWDLSPEDCQNNTTIIWEQIRKGGDYETVKNDIQHSAENLSPWHSKWRNVLPNGELRWHEGFGTPYSLANGVILFNSMIFDVTEQVKLANLYDETSHLAKIGSWEMDLVNQDNGDAMYWSPMVREIIEVDEHYDASLSGGIEFYAQESQVIVKQAIETLIEEGIGYDIEVLLITQTGKEKWVRIIGKCERYNGVCTKIYGSIQDIHTMKTTALQLKELLSSISDAFYAVDRQWNFTYFNREAEELLDIKSEAVLGKNIWKTFAPVVDTKLETVYRRVAKSENTESFEYRYPGNNSWYEISVYPSNGGVSVYFRNIEERKKAVEALQKAYEEKNQIIESIGDAFFTMDNNFTVTYWNKVAEKLVHVKREDILGKNLWDVFPDAVDLPSYTNYHKVMKTKKPIMFKDYYGVWLEVNAYPSVDGISVFFRDITHRKEADERLKKAYEEKNQILESIGDAFFAVDKNWVVTYWNKEAEHVLGKKKKVIVGKNLWKEYADAIDTDFYHQYHRAMETGETVSFEEYYATLNKWFEVTAYPSPEGLSVYFKDITLRKETDIRIQQANERFEKVTQATTDAIWDWDLENDMFYRGDGFEKLFGYEVPKVLTKKQYWKDSYHPEDLPVIKRSIRKALNNPQKEHWEMQYRIIHASGEEKTVMEKGIIMRNDQGKAVRMIGAVADISDRIHYENELLELNKTLKKNVKELEFSNQQLEQFAFITSHDLQEPLRMITSFLNLLQKKYGSELDEKAHQYIHFATDGAKRMKQIILDLLEYSKAGKEGEELEAVDLHQLLEEYHILRSKLMEEKKAVLKTENLPVVMALKTPLTQVIHNLLDNAIKYSKVDVPPVVQISVQDKKTYWQVQVQDNGLGIDEKFFDKIFVIFQRLHNREQFDGTGIGLALSKKQVESWGGKIWVKSKPNKGSTFYFTIQKPTL